MGILKTLRNTFFSPRPKSRYYSFQVKCKRCGEILESRVDLYNDLSLDYESDTPVYFCRKVLMGAGPCHQSVETTFKFDELRNVSERQAGGGEFVD